MDDEDLCENIWRSQKSFVYLYIIKIRYKHKNQSNVKENQSKHNKQ